VRATHRFLCAIAVALAATSYPNLDARAAPTLWVCMATEGESGEQSDCPAPGPNEIFRFFNSSWDDLGPDQAIAHDSVSATWSVLTGESSIYARYGAAVGSGFVNDHNSVSARLDADDFVITGIIFKTLVVPAEPDDTCPMTIGGGNADASGSSGYGVYASHFGGPALFTSDPCTLNANEPFRIRLDLGASASLITQFPYNLPLPGAEGSASARFSASFPSAGPVFNLPVGYTATSLIAQVEDNGYVPGRRRRRSRRSRCSRSRCCGAVRVTRTPEQRGEHPARDTRARRRARDLAARWASLASHDYGRRAARIESAARATAPSSAPSGSGARKNGNVAS
jgi:hypothetical protein